MAKTAAEDTSERRRLSIPKVNESVLQWWDAQHDVSLSVQMLIRAEIERNGYADTAFGPVTQQPRRGRPAGSGGDPADPEGQDAVAHVDPPAPVQIKTAPSAQVAQPAPAPVQIPAAVSEGMSPIDALMNG